MTAPVVTLTFDNGPTPGITDAVLDVLAAHAVPATFFAIGHKLATPEGADLGRQIVEPGSSPRRAHVEPQRAVRRRRRRRAARRARPNRAQPSTPPVVRGTLFRPYGAGGVIDDRLMSSFGASALCAGGYTCVLWNVLPGDWRDADGWVDAALEEIDRHPGRWSCCTMSSTPRLPGSTSSSTGCSGTIRRGRATSPTTAPRSDNGRPTSSFDTLCVSM